MQVRVRYQDFVKIDESFVRAIIILAQRYNDKPYLIGGTMGVNVTGLSWSEAYEFVAKVVDVIRKHGALLIEEIEISVRRDDPVHDSPIIRRLKNKGN